MKVLAKLFFITTLFSLLFSFAHAGLLSISEKEINDYLRTHLSEKVPLEDSVGIPKLFQLDYRLHSLNTQIGHTEDKRVAITGIIESKLTSRNKHYDIQLSLNMDTLPYYESEKGEIYLKDVRLLNWQTNSEKYAKELQMFMPLIADGLTSILNNTPVYRLDEQKTKEALIKKFAKNIIVEKERIRLETQIF